MAKNRANHGESTTEAASPTSEAVPQIQSEAATHAANFTLNFKRNHPQDRASYGIPGVAGIAVFQRGLFAGAVPFTSNSDLGGLPATITLNVELVQPKASNTEAKAVAAAAKAQEKADKAKAKAEAAQKKIEEKAAATQKKLEDAKAKLAAAAPAPVTDEAPVQAEDVENL